MEGSFSFKDITSEQLTHFSSGLREIVGELDAKNKLELLDLLVIWIIKDGQASNEQEAVSILNQKADQVVQELEKGSIPVTCTDLIFKSRPAILNYLKSLREEMSEEEETGKRKSSHQLFGVKSHKNILSLFNHFLPDADKLRSWLGIDSGQSNFDFMDENGQDNIPYKMKDILSPEILDLIQEVVFLKGEISESLFNRVNICWHRALGIFTNNNSEQDDSVWKGISDEDRKTMAELEDLMFIIFNEALREIQQYKITYGDAGEHLYYLSLMTWARAVIYVYESKRRALFLEVPVVSSSHHIPGGSIDALEVVSINNYPLNRNQHNVIWEMSRQRFKSARHIIDALIGIFGPRIGIKVLELKFSVGDAVKSNRIISPDQVRDGSLGNHVRQLLKYMILTSWEYDLYHNGFQENSDLLGKSYFRHGEILYLMPLISPIVHSIRLENTEQMEDILRQEIAFRWQRAKEQARRQEMIKSLFKAVKLPINSEKVLLSLQNNHDQMILFSPEDSKERISLAFERMIQGLRRFIDKDTKIVEVVGFDKKGHPRYSMNYQQLLKQIDKGVVKTDDDFSPKTSGFISCINPEHPDEEPSMRIDLGTGSFHCFGISCQLSGFILYHSIPKEIRGSIIRTSRKGKRKAMDRGPLVVSPRHLEIMKMTQEIFQDELLGSSQARRYLEEERALDFGRAYELGAGFANNHAIEKLVEMGVSFEELKYYGFLSFSKNIKPSYGICPIFTHHGLKLEEIQGKTKNGEIGLPFFLLNRGITAPLTLSNGDINSFCCRLIKPPSGKRPHRKLSKKFSNVRHGGINLQELRSERPAIAVVEGFMDYLSIRQMGINGVIALLGGMNSLMLGNLAFSRKDIILWGLDFDPEKLSKTGELIRPGREATEKATQDLLEAGFKGEIEDLTEEFVGANPECADSKDWNDVLKNHGSKPFPLKVFDLEAL